MLLFYWRKSARRKCRCCPPSLQSPASQRAHLAARYTKRIGVCPKEIDYCVALASYMFAVIAQGIVAWVSRVYIVMGKTDPGADPHRQ
jgi:hypothetical protein